MPKPPLPDDVAELLRRPNPAVVAVLMPSGDPMSVATWYLVEDDGRILLNMDAQPRPCRLDARAAAGRADRLQGRGVVHARQRPRDRRRRGTDDETRALADIDRLSTHYTGNPYRVRDRARISAWMQVEHWHGWGEAKASDA